MKTILDRPLFKLIPAREPVAYANVTNAMEVSLAEKMVTHYIEIGTELFHLMYSMKVPRDSQVMPFLDIVGRRAVFGVMVNATDLLDLWTLPLSEVPDWIGDESHWSLAP